MWFKAGKKKESGHAGGEHRPRDGEGNTAAEVLSRQIASALQHHQAGHLSDAEVAYKGVLAADPGNADALHFLGVISFQRGEFERAAELIAAALSRNPMNAAAHNNLGNVLNAQGKSDRAVASYREAIRIEPKYVDAYLNLGAALRKQGSSDDAIESYRKAVALAPNAPTVHFDLGGLLAEKGRYEEAATCYRKAVELKPDFAAAYSNLGNTLRSLALEREDQELLGEAVRCYRKAIEFDPGFPEARSNLGNVLRDLGRLDEAVDCYRQAVALAPSFPEACVNLGNALDEQGRRDEALTWLRRAIALRPDLPEAHAGLANALKNLGELNQAIASYRQALALDPRAVDTLYRLGDVLREQDALDEASSCYRKVLSIDPEHVQARWALTMSRLPAVFDANPDLGNWRNEFSRELEQLDRWFDDARAVRGYRAVGVQTPFYLAYQEESNRELLHRHGQLCARIMDHWLRRQGISTSSKRPQGGAIKIGIVSRHLRNHSIWNAIVKGWFQNLDQRRFSLSAFYLGTDEDDETLYAKARAQHFEQGARTLSQWVEAIARERLDILVYPEIGMDAMTVKLASLRLVPVQATTWGHPETSGLPTIDYYLSAQDMEPPRAKENYTEKLVMLPHIGCYCEPRELVTLPPDLKSLGVESTIPMLLCPGVPFKYAPRYDWVLTEIARQLGQCQFVFFVYQIPEQSEKLRRRLEGEFHDRGLEFDRFVRFIPWQSGPQFLGLLERADVFLDSIGFSTFNTALQAVECGTPIVTREGRFLRGRTGSGILKRMGLQDLVAESEEDYVALAIRVARDPAYREHVRERIREKRALVFRDLAPVRALENFFTAAVIRST